jgi:hypothetical protein
VLFFLVSNGIFFYTLFPSQGWLVDCLILVNPVVQVIWLVFLALDRRTTVYYALKFSLCLLSLLMLVTLLCTDHSLSINRRLAHLLAAYILVCTSICAFFAVFCIFLTLVTILAGGALVGIGALVLVLAYLAIKTSSDAILTQFRSAKEQCQRKLLIR